MHLLIGALFTIRQVLSFPIPADLGTDSSGNYISYVLNVRGIRSLWFAAAPDFVPRELWHSPTDDGQELTNVSVSSDGKFVVYVLGGDHEANWPQRPWPDPDSGVKEAHMTVMSLATNGTAEPKVLGDGDTPVISPDNGRVAFVHDPDSAVWSAPIDGSKDSSVLFFDKGSAGDLAWSPNGKALAFTSDRGDHSFIGIYRDGAGSIEYLTPSTSRDSLPRWSPDGRRVAYVRIDGNGGPPQDPLKNYPQPWWIMVADASSGRGHAVWHSGTTLRDSLPGIKGPQLYWAAGNRLVFISEQTNWPNLYSVSADGGAVKPLSRGSFMVEDTAISPDRRTIYFTANTGKTPGDDDRRHVFSVQVDGSTAPVAVTHGTDSQWWPAATRRGVAYAQAGPRVPMTIALDGRTLDADQIPADFPTSSLVVPREVSFRAADGLLIHGTIFAPTGDAKKKPAVIYVHGGPTRQMLLTWHYFDYYSYGYATDQYLASRGFVVLSVNYRLGIGYGHDFQNPDNTGPAGAAEYEDVLAGAHFLRGDPNVDSSRIGIWGGSYGGYLTAMALAKNSDVFKVGVDWHGVHDWSQFPEWFGLGSAPLKRYEAIDEKKFLKTLWFSSPDAYVSTWRSPVLLIHGDDDRNVRFHQTVDLAIRLKQKGVPFEEMVIPNEIHGFLRWESWLEADEATAEFLIRNLRP
jgi:dipeptidyl aminopeptidase/acylaminoacyl peptidase